MIIKLARLFPLLCFIACMAMPVAAADPVPVGPPGVWQLVFQDEFDGDRLDTSKWHSTWFNVGGTMNNVATAASNVTVSGGEVRLQLSTSATGALIHTYPYRNSGRFAARVDDYIEASICMCGFAMAAEPSLMAQTELGEKRLVCKRIAEGMQYYELVTSTSSELLWKSFWGRGTGVFSPDGNFLTIADTGRFNVLGPILVFKLSGKRTWLVYQSPANFSSEEDRFGYKIIKLSNDDLQIGVNENVFTAASSRATEGKGITYAVDLKSLKTITPSFYATDHSLYYNVNDDEP